MKVAWTSCWRGPAGVSFRQCLRTATAATSMALAVAVIAGTASRSNLIGESPAAAATPWLTLPLLVAAFACSLTATSLWPLFALQQPGADTIRRLERGRFGGRAAVALGALLAQLMLSIPITLVMGFWLDAPRSARSHHEVQLQASSEQAPVLNGAGDSLAFEIAGGPTIRALWLRPRAGLPNGTGPTHWTITHAGELLAATRVTFSESGIVMRVSIEPQPLTEFTLTQTSGDVPLYFGNQSITAIGSAERSTWWNCIIAACIATCSSAITLLIAAFVGVGASWPTLATTVCCAQFVQWIGGIGPVDEAMLNLLRGQWLL